LNITLPTSGQVQWDGALNDVLQAIVDVVEAKVTADGIDIKSSLDLQGNYLINIEGLKFAALAADDGTARQVWWGTDNELHVRDGAGRAIQVTSGGALNISLNGGIGGDYVGSSAQVVFSSSGAVYTFTSSPGAYATLEAGDLKVHNGSSSTYTDVKTSPNNNATYTLTLPAAVPSALSLLTMDATGTVNPTRDPSVSSVTASNVQATNLTGPSATPIVVQNGATLSGTLRWTTRTLMLHGSDAQGIGGAQYNTSINPGVWTINQTGSVDHGLRVEPGERIDQIDVIVTRLAASPAVTASLYFRPLTSGTPAQLIAQRSATTASVGAGILSLGAGLGILTGTMPHMASSSGTYFVKVETTTVGTEAYYGLKLTTDKIS
jgi:hypothetical protein